MKNEEFWCGTFGSAFSFVFFSILHAAATTILKNFSVVVQLWHGL
jgi:hypothetical protein